MEMQTCLIFRALLAAVCCFVTVTAVKSGLRIDSNTKTVIIRGRDSSRSVALAGESLREVIGDARHFSVAEGPIRGRLGFDLRGKQCKGAQGQGLSNFSREALETGHVYYCPNKKLTWDAFAISLKSTRRTSSMKLIWIVVVSSGEESKINSLNKTYVTSKIGQRLTIMANSSVFRTTKQLAANSKIIVLKQPRFGNLSLGSSFTLQDVIDGKLAYRATDEEACGEDIPLLILRPDALEGSEFRVLFVVFEKNASALLSPYSSVEKITRFSKFLLTKTDLQLENAFSVCDDFVQVEIKDLGFQNLHKTGTLYFKGTAIEKDINITLKDIQNGLLEYALTDFTTNQSRLFFLCSLLNLPSNPSYIGLIDLTITLTPCTGSDCEEYTAEVSVHTPKVVELQLENLYGFGLQDVLDVSIEPEIAPDNVLVRLVAPTHSDIWIYREKTDRILTVQLSKLKDVKIVVVSNQEARSGNVTLSLLVNHSNTLVPLRGEYTLPVNFASISLEEPQYASVVKGRPVEAYVRASGVIRQNTTVNVTVSWRGVSRTETIVFSPGDAKERLYRIPTDDISLHDKVLIRITPVSGAIPLDGAIVSYNTTIIPGSEGSTVDFADDYSTSANSTLCEKNHTMSQIGPDGIDVFLSRWPNVQHKAGVVGYILVDDAEAPSGSVERPRNSFKRLFFEANNARTTWTIDREDLLGLTHFRMVIENDDSGSAFVKHNKRRLCVYIADAAK